MDNRTKLHEVMQSAKSRIEKFCKTNYLVYPTNQCRKGYQDGMGELTYNEKQKRLDKMQGVDPDNTVEIR